MMIINTIIIVRMMVVVVVMVVMMMMVIMMMTTRTMMMMMKTMMMMMTTIMMMLMMVVGGVHATHPHVLEGVAEPGVGGEGADRPHAQQLPRRIHTARQHESTDRFSSDPRPSLYAPPV
jgi:hypothetical protein